MKIERNYYLTKLIDRRDHGGIKVITGIRRCGKSVLPSAFSVNRISLKLARPDSKFSMIDSANSSVSGRFLTI